MLGMALAAGCVPLFLATPRAQAPGAAPVMVSVPAGDFWMGRTRLWLMDEIGWQIRDRYDDRPVHRVSLDAFSMDRYEVTNGDYAAFVEGDRRDSPLSLGRRRAAYRQSSPARLQRVVA